MNEIDFQYAGGLFDIDRLSPLRSWGFGTSAVTRSLAVVAFAA